MYNIDKLIFFLFFAVTILVAHLISSARTPNPASMNAPPETAGDKTESAVPAPAWTPRIRNLLREPYVLTYFAVIFVIVVLTLISVRVSVRQTPEFRLNYVEAILTSNLLIQIVWAILAGVFAWLTMSYMRKGERNTADLLARGVPLILFFLLGTFSDFGSNFLDRISRVEGPSFAINILQENQESKEIYLKTEDEVPFQNIPDFQFATDHLFRLSSSNAAQDPRRIENICRFLKSSNRHRGGECIHVAATFDDLNDGSPSEWVFEAGKEKETEEVLKDYLMSKGLDELTRASETANTEDSIFEMDEKKNQMIVQKLFFDNLSPLLGCMKAYSLEFANGLPLQDDLWEIAADLSSYTLSDQPDYESLNAELSNFAHALKESGREIAGAKFCEGDVSNEDKLSGITDLAWHIRQKMQRDIQSKSIYMAIYESLVMFASGYGAEGANKLHKFYQSRRFFNDNGRPRNSWEVEGEKMISDIVSLFERIRIVDYLDSMFFQLGEKRLRLKILRDRSFYASEMLKVFGFNLEDADSFFKSCHGVLWKSDVENPLIEHDLHGFANAWVEYALRSDASLMYALARSGDYIDEDILRQAEYLYEIADNRKNYDNCLRTRSEGIEAVKLRAQLAIGYAKVRLARAANFDFSAVSTLSERPQGQEAAVCDVRSALRRAFDITQEIQSRWSGRDSWSGNRKFEESLEEVINEIRQTWRAAGPATVAC